MYRKNNLSLVISTIALFSGLAVFYYNWSIYGGGWPYFRIILFPGNLVLSLFTEEIDFWPKFWLQMSGQFIVTFVATDLFIRGLRFLLRPNHNE